MLYNLAADKLGQIQPTGPTGLYSYSFLVIVASHSPVSLSYYVPQQCDQLGFVKPELVILAYLNIGYDNIVTINRKLLVVYCRGWKIIQ